MSLNPNYMFIYYYFMSVGIILYAQDKQNDIFVLHIYDFLRTNKLENWSVFVFCVLFLGSSVLLGA